MFRIKRSGSIDIPSKRDDQHESKPHSWNNSKGTGLDTGNWEDDVNTEMVPIPVFVSGKDGFTITDKSWVKEAPGNVFKCEPPVIRQENKLSFFAPQDKSQRRHKQHRKKKVLGAAPAAVVDTQQDHCTVKYLGNNLKLTYKQSH